MTRNAIVVKYASHRARPPPGHEARRCRPFRTDPFAAARACAACIATRDSVARRRAPRLRADTARRLRRGVAGRPGRRGCRPAIRAAVRAAQGTHRRAHARARHRLRPAAGAADVGSPAGTEPRRPVADGPGPRGAHGRARVHRPPPSGSAVPTFHPDGPHGPRDRLRRRWRLGGAGRRSATRVRLCDCRHPQPVRGAARPRATRTTRRAGAPVTASLSSRTIPTGSCTTTRTRCPPCGHWTTSG